MSQTRELTCVDRVTSPTDGSAVECGEAAFGLVGALPYCFHHLLAYAGRINHPAHIVPLPVRSSDVLLSDETKASFEGLINRHLSG